MSAHTAFLPGEVRLRGGLLAHRSRLNRDYLLSLKVDNLLQNHRLEAGIGRPAILRGSAPDGTGDDRHWGWETPGSPMRGHFVGHWMSAAAREVAVTGDPEVAARLRVVIDGIAECQTENGGEWAFALSERAFDRLSRGRVVWSPQYAVHKTLMGLVDAARETNDGTALAVAVNASRWFDRWTAGFTRDEFDDILDVETGGMLEVWADLLDLTGDPMFARLLGRYRRPRLFDPLTRGEDVLTNMHANTTIPEILGAARAYEVTGEQSWRAVVEAYWRFAVTERGTFCTGGQTSGEIWTPPFAFAARRSDKTQEHCSVYNMIRLAETLFRWTGEAHYLDYIERNVYNGLLAQQHPTTGMVAYFLPLEGGARKLWGTPTEDFWCCHGTLVQAHTRHGAAVFYRGQRSITVAMYEPATLTTTFGDSPISVQLDRGDQVGEVGAHANAGEAGPRHRPESWDAQITVRAAAPVSVTLRLRIPDWTAGEATVRINGEAVEVAGSVRDGFLELERTWQDDVVDVTLPKQVTIAPIPDEPTTVAFLDGPMVLAATGIGEVTLHADAIGEVVDLLRPDNERQWAQWLGGWRIVGQPQSIRLMPLHAVADETYTVYFPVGG